MATNCGCPDRNSSIGCPDIAKTMLTLYAACYTDVTAITYDTLDEFVTGISGTTLTGFTSGFFVEIAVPFETSGFDVQGNINKNNNTYLFNPTVTFKIASLSEDTIKLFEAFVKSKVMVVVKLQGPTYYLLGGENGLVAETANLTSSTTGGDFAGATLTLSSFGESKSARQLNAAAVADFLANNVATL
jgi:hypothetical protein